jgi:hypothetical protein
MRGVNVARGGQGRMGAMDGWMDGFRSSLCDWWHGARPRLALKTVPSRSVSYLCQLVFVFAGHVSVFMKMEERFFCLFSRDSVFIRN